MSLFSCGQCKATYSEAKGFCSGCESWGTVSEVSFGRAKGNKRVLLESKDRISKAIRLKTGIEGVDRVLGGGLVHDSLVLLSGEPGVGKSTLILEIIKGFLKSESDLSILYTSGEESESQVRERAVRLSVQGGKRVFLLCETSLDNIIAEATESRARVLIVDSIQTMVSDELDAPAGSVSQMKEVSSQLMKFAKTRGIACLLIGHVTKDGELAGPKMVEHLVDAVLTFDSSADRSQIRCLSSSKNRFGSTREAALFEMNETGLRSLPISDDSVLK